MLLLGTTLFCFGSTDRNRLSHNSQGLTENGGSAKLQDMKQQNMKITDMKLQDEKHSINRM